MQISRIGEVCNDSEGNDLWAYTRLTLSSLCFMVSGLVQHSKITVFRWLYEFIRQYKSDR